jgi:hypothetical protein
VPATLILDELNGAVLQTGIGNIRGRRIRTGRIKGITVTGTTTAPDSTVLERCLAVPGMPQLASPCPKTGIPAVDAVIKNYVLLQHVFTPFTASHIKVQLVYMEPRANMIHMRGAQGITRLPIRIGWTDPNNPDHKVPEDFLMMVYDKPYRSIGLTGLVYGSVNPTPTIGQLDFSPPPRAQREAIGCVNSTDFYGYPRGFWRVDEYETDSRTNQSYYTVTGELTTRKTQDWSEQGILRNQMTGRYVPVKQDDIDILMNQPYPYGMISLPDKGLVRVGQYEPIDLSQIFPILTAPTSFGGL